MLKEKECVTVITPTSTESDSTGKTEDVIETGTGKTENVIETEE